MNSTELKEAIAKYIESKELVLMGYSPEYIDDVKTDMEIAFKAGAEWMAEQGETQEHFVIGHTEASHGIPVIVTFPDPKTFEIGDNVIVQIRKKEE